MCFIAYQPYPLPQNQDPLNGPIGRRHVIYIQGLFPRGPDYYYALLEKQLTRHAELYGLKATCSPLLRINPLLVRCEIMMQSDGRSVHTTYDFLDWEDLIKTAHQRSVFYTVLRAARTFADHFLDGTFIAMLRAWWKFAIAWILPYIMFALVGLFAVIFAKNLFHIFWKYEGFAPLVKIGISGFAILGLLRLSRFYWCAVMIRDFNYASLYAKGKVPELEKRISDFSDIVTDICKTSEADEILIVGHSFSGQLAARVAAGAARKGAFARNDNHRIKLLTLGDAGCHVALMKGAGAARVRQDIFAIASQKELPWVLIYSGKDVLAFNTADPPSLLRKFEGGNAHISDFFWPLMYDARFRSAMKEEDYHRMRWRFFHIHGQYIMAARLKSAHFDYLRAVCGAEPLSLSGKRISAKAIKAI
jgi:hypothetical protein